VNLLRQIQEFNSAKVPGNFALGYNPSSEQGSAKEKTE